MGLRPTQGDEKRLLSSNRSPWKRRTPLCHPERTRISYYAAPEMATCAAFIEESRMKFADPTKLDRKSGAAEGSAVPRTFLGNVFRQSVTRISYRAAPNKSTCAAFLKESRMKLASATKPDRKSGGA
jgi:hypothetical protein